MRQYGIFIQPRGQRRWVRMFPKRSYGKQTAIRVFQSLLLGCFFRGKKVELRPLKKETV